MTRKSDGCGYRRSRFSLCWLPIRWWSRRRGSATGSSRPGLTFRRCSPGSTCWVESRWCRWRIRHYDYHRAAFGDAWTDDNDAPGGHNGCDTRDDVLNRDLVDKTYVWTKHCPDAVETGTLHDPYTNATINYEPRIDAPRRRGFFRWMRLGGARRAGRQRASTLPLSDSPTPWRP